MICNGCPRECNVDRENNVGVCGVKEMPKVAKAYLHMWEEPIITGDKGSGTIFFSGCNLKCVYCQNYKISSEGFGQYITVEKLAEIFKKLEQQGATNINLVSPSHYAKTIKSALDIYRPNIPIVYNSNGYDSIQSLELLKDYIDIYLMDFKYYSHDIAQKYSNAYNYPDIVKQVLLKIREYCPEEIIENGVMKKGLVIRHLVLPNNTKDSINVLRWIKENINNPFISLMGQYVPMFKSHLYPEINRKLKPLEYKIVENELIKLGLTNGYTQDLDSAEEGYTPDFDLTGIE